MTQKIDTAALLQGVDIVQVIDARVPLTKAGAEFEACCPFHGEDTPSFKVSPTKQIYHCFGCGANGDAIKFLQQHQGLSFKDACAALGGSSVAPAPEKAPEKARPKPEPSVSKSSWTPVLPVPETAFAPPERHPRRGTPERIWCYRDASGAVLGYVYRFRTSDGGKEVLPLVWARDAETGELMWRWMAFPAPRPLYGLDRLAAMPDAPVLVVEGEKCVGAAQPELPDLAVVAWAGGSKAVGKSDWLPLSGRRVMLWADCDAKRVPLTPAERAAGVDPLSKPLLPEDKQPGVQAMAQVAEKLHALGCKVWRVKIPAPGEKQDGWDVADAISEDLCGDELADFIRSNAVLLATAEEGDAPAGIAPPSPPEGGGGGEKKKPKEVDWERFHELLDQFVLVYSTDTCFDLHARLLIKVNHLRLAYGNDYVKMWLASDRRKMILPSQLVFDPSGQCLAPEVNLFDGLPVKPRSGDCAAIMELLCHLCSEGGDMKGNTDAVVRWVLCWLALPLQRLGTKMRSALIFHGPQGAGKNLFFEIVARIYGRYALVVGQDQIEDRFNSWASQKLFLIGDEVVARQELYHHKNKLKSFITGETIPINEKMMPLRIERNHVNVVFLSNEHQPLALEEGDRRYLVVYTPPERDDDLYLRVDACLKRGGMEAFYRRLLDMDLSGFTEYDHPPMTQAKRDLIDLGLKPGERFFREWLSGFLPLPLQVCSAGQLYQVFRRWCSYNGERFPPSQDQFTKSGVKTVDLLGHKAKRKFLAYKVVRLSPPVDGKKSERIWIPGGCGAPEGTPESHWAAEAVQDFEKALSAFMDRTQRQMPSGSAS